MALCVPDRDDMELDLTGDLSKLKKHVFTIKEGVQYKIRIDFVVQREIVHGLKYVQKTYRMALPGKKAALLYLELKRLNGFAYHTVTACEKIVLADFILTISANLSISVKC